LVVLNLLLIYNQKHYYASSLNKLCELVCARTIAWEYSCASICMKQNVVCNYAAFAAILYITITANICSYMLSKNEPSVLMKLFL